jgi:anaerobic magnesium-protoporphyrin IX monomethyl ester cyclase
MNKITSEKKTLLLFVLPYFVGKTNAFDAKTRSYLAFPYGAISIATYVKHNSTSSSEVIVVDLNKPTIKDVMKEFTSIIKKKKCDVIGFNFMFDTSFKWLHDLSKITKQIQPDIPIIAGGASATLSYDELTNEIPYIDAICYSEGEIAVCELLDSNSINDSFTNDPWYTKEKTKKPKVLAVDHLDEVINLDYETVDVASYSMKESFSPYCSYRDEKDVKQFFLVTSRGCPFKCTFCSEPALHGANMRYSSVDEIEKHVAMLVDKYGANVITFYDDQLIMNVPRAKELFRRLIKYNLRLEAPNGVTAVFIDDEMAELMEEAGFDSISLAIESGSDYVLRNIINKPLRLPKLRKVIRSLRKTKIFIQGFFVIGMPGEKDEHRKESYDLVKELDLDWASFSIASPVRGSQLYIQAKNNGWLTNDFGVGKLMHNSYQMNIPGIDPQHIVDSAYNMNLSLNFVNNRALRNKDYETARRIFLEVTERTNEHAFGYWFLSVANKELGFSKEAVNAKNKAFSIIDNSEKWSHYAKHYNLI